MIKRYNITCFLSDYGVDKHDDDNGEWVRYEDIKHLLSKNTTIIRRTMSDAGIARLAGCPVRYALAEADLLHNPIKFSFNDQKIIDGAAVIMITVEALSRQS